MAFYITRVTATGIGRTPATVTFDRGLNLICGVSDSGKTCILKCIQFAMGDSKKPFDKVKTGYDCVNLEISTPNGTITFSRYIGKNVVNVVSKVEGIIGGDYDTDYKPKGNKNPVLNELWLKIIGINNLPMIIKNQDFERQRLTWKTLMGLFWLKEQEIENPKSVILPDVTTQYPYFLACLIYLLTGNNFPDGLEQDKDEISAAKRKAVHQFVNKQIAQMSDKREQLQRQLISFGDMDIEEQIQKLLDNLSETEESIVAATEESKDLLGTLLGFKEKEAEIAMTYSQFQSLKSQYTSDIKRLTFIVEGEIHMHSVDENTNCPFCNGAIQPKQKESYIEASRAELARIITQLKGLAESENDVALQLEETRRKIRILELRRLEIDALIDKELTPHADLLKAGISQYRSYVQVQKEISVLHSISQDWNTELQKQDEEPSDKPKFKPKSHFPDTFNVDLDKIAFDILSKCQYEGLNTVHFNMGTFDLQVNGLPKEDSHGKGYWAFINTVLGLTFRQYIKQNAMYKPGLFVVDTPLLGLDQGIDDNAPSSMRTALFQYFIDSQSNGQMIVVENTKDLPDLDYIGGGAKVIEFTHDKYESKYESRYGFLHDVFKSDLI